MHNAYTIHHIQDLRFFIFTIGSSNLFYRIKYVTLNM